MLTKNNLCRNSLDDDSFNCFPIVASASPLMPRTTSMRKAQRRTRQPRRGDCSKHFSTTWLGSNFQGGPGKGALNESPTIKGAQPIEPKRNRRPVNGLHVSRSINSLVKSPPRWTDTTAGSRFCLALISTALPLPAGR
jgi:hypothetical protein